MDLNTTPLQPLRITQGWSMSYNNGLYEIDPSDNRILESDSWWLFKEDMLQLKHERYNKLLDLGWYPEGDLINGKYGLELYEGDFTGKKLHEFSTNLRSEIVAEIERILKSITNPET